MAASEMTELVREHRLKLLGLERLHERQANRQIVPVQAEHPQPRNLRDTGVEFDGDEDAVKGRRAKLASQLLHQREERRRFLALERSSLRRRELHPQRLHGNPDEDAERHGELERNRLRRDDRAKRNQEKHEKKPEYEAEVTVPCESQGDDA